MAQREHLDDQRGPTPGQERQPTQYSHRDDVDNKDDHEQRSLPPPADTRPAGHSSRRVLALYKVRGVNGRTCADAQRNNPRNTISPTGPSSANLTFGASDTRANNERIQL
jgi:hypothetical protein